MAYRTYRVLVTQDDHVWLADVPGMEGTHTYAHSFPDLDKAIRETIVLAAELPEETMPDIVLDYEYNFDEDSYMTTARACTSNCLSQPKSAGSA